MMLTDALERARVKLAEHESPGPYYFVLPLDSDPSLQDEAAKAAKFLGEVREGLLYRLR